MLTKEIHKCYWLSDIFTYALITPFFNLMVVISVIVLYGNIKNPIITQWSSLFVIKLLFVRSIIILNYV